MKAENSEEINVFLCHDNSPENSPIAPTSGLRTATSTRLHHLANQRFNDPLFNNIDAMSTKFGLGEWANLLEYLVILICNISPLFCF